LLIDRYIDYTNGWLFYCKPKVSICIDNDVHALAIDAISFVSNKLVVLEMLSATRRYDNVYAVHRH